MSQPISSTAATHSRLARLQQLGLLEGAAHARALALAGLDSQRQRWLQRLDTALLYAGATLIACGIVFFFAYNWTALHHLARFALLAAGIAASVALALWRGLDQAGGQAALGVAAVQAGVLLASYGQAYQTGADPYGLFAAWAVVITPWALAARGRVLWLLWLGLSNLALGLYWIELVSPRLTWLRGIPDEFGAMGWFAYLYLDAGLALAASSLNLTVLVAHEWAAATTMSLAVTGRTVVRAAAAMTAVTACMAAIMAILDFDTTDPTRVAAPVVFTALMAGGVAYYLLRGRDLFMLAVLYLAIIVVTTVLLAAVTAFNAGAYLVLGVLVCALAAGAAVLLRRHAGSFARRARPTAESA